MVYANRILTPSEASSEFEINPDYFQNEGGVYICDSRDSLIDYSKMNEFIWDYLPLFID